MNLKRVLWMVVSYLGITVLNSCSDENELVMPPISQQNEQEGRFDNVPFQWDYYLSNDSTSTGLDGFVVYPVKLESAIETRVSTDGRRPTTGTRPPRNSTGGGAERPRRPSTFRGFDTDNILIRDPHILYVGAAFPEKEFGRDFSREITAPRNPMYVYTSFPDPYLDEITRESGSFGYRKFIKSVIRSDEYQKFIHSDAREKLELQYVEFFSYSDIEKAFSSNAGLAKVFSAKVQMNSKKTNIKSRLLGQLISSCFTVSMDVPTNGFFKDQSMNSSPEYPVYVRSMTYGKIALLAIESEYSFEEVKKAVEAGIKFKFFSGGANYTAKDMEIIQKSTITILVISDDTSGEVNQYFDSLDALKGAFSTKYTELNYGMPILCTGYYAIDNKVFKANVRLRSEPWPAPVTSSSGKSRPAPRPSYP